MGRIRTIKPEFPQSESIGRLSRDARLLFIQLWTICDDSGRARAASRMLASLLYPYDSDAAKLMDRWLKELEDQGCIRRYAVEGSSYLEVSKWLTHQKIDRPSQSRLPSFDESSRVLGERSVTDPDLGRDVDQEKDLLLAQSSDELHADIQPVGTLPCAGDKKSWPFYQAKLDQWKEAYPAIDVLGELRQVRQWLIDNPTRRKTFAGMPRFINGWLAKEQNGFHPGTHGSNGDSKMKFTPPEGWTCA